MTARQSESHHKPAKLNSLKNYQHEWIANEPNNAVVDYTTTYHRRTIIGNWLAERAKKDKQKGEERLHQGQLQPLIKYSSY